MRSSSPRLAASCSLARSLPVARASFALERVERPSTRCMLGIDPPRGLECRPPQHQPLLFEQRRAQLEAVIGFPLCWREAIDRTRKRRSNRPFLIAARACAARLVAVRHGELAASIAASRPTLEPATRPISEATDAAGDRRTRIAPAITQLRELTGIEDIIRSTRSARRPASDAEAVDTRSSGTIRSASEAGPGVLLTGTAPHERYSMEPASLTASAAALVPARSSSGSAVRRRISGRAALSDTKHGLLVATAQLPVTIVDPRLLWCRDRSRSEFTLRLFLATYMLTVGYSRRSVADWRDPGHFLLPTIDWRQLKCVHAVERLP